MTLVESRVCIATVETLILAEGGAVVQRAGGHHAVDSEAFSLITPPNDCPRA